MANRPRVEFRQIYMPLDDGRPLDPDRPINLRRWREDFRVLRETAHCGVDLEGGTIHGRRLTQIGYYPEKLIRRLLDLLADAGLDAYLNVFSGMEPIGDDLALASREGWLCRDRDGHELPSFNAYNPDWRQRWLRPFLTNVVERYASHPAVAGFRVGDVWYVGGVPGESERHRFRDYLRSRYVDLSALNEAWGNHLASWDDILPPRLPMPWSRAWTDWCDAQGEWLADFATETVQCLRGVPGRPQHPVLIFAPCWLTTSPGDYYSGFTGRFFEPFQVIGVCGNYPKEYHSRETGLTAIDRSIEMIRRLAPNVRLCLSDMPGPRWTDPSPTEFYPAEMMIEMMRLSIDRGVDYVLYDGYRKAHVATAVAYAQTFAYHPHILRQLAEFHREINS